MRIDGPSTAAPTPEHAPDPMEDPQFQELFVRTMLAEVSKSMPEGSLLGGELEMFGDILLDELSTQLAASGTLSSHGTSLPSGWEDRLSIRTSAVLPVIGRESSAFGTRRDPIHGHDRHHAGLDIAAAEGTPIRAALSGTVIRADSRGGYGNAVEVEHADGTRALYAHCSRIDVRPGEKIRAGQLIAAVGSTGRSTGPHLHFELRVDGEAVDPQSRLAFRNP